MLKLSIVFGLLASIIWRTTPTNCRQTPPTHSNVNHLIAANIQNFMDTSARPCENFYQYACGHWYQHHIEQVDFGDTLGLLEYELNKKLEHVLKRLGNVTADEDEESSFYQKVHTYYKSCKKVKPYNLKKYLLLVQPNYETSWYILSRSGGKNWQAERFDWLQAVAKLRLYGLNGVLLKEEILPRWDESSSNSIYLDKPNLIETEPMGEGAAIELMLDIGQTKRVANEISREVHAFELQLHKLQEIEDEEGAKEMQLSYLQEYMPQIDWLEYIRQLKGPTTNLATTVIIQNVPYMRALVKLLNTTERETVCNYVMLKFLHFLKQQGPAEISKQECVSSLRRAMPLAMSYIIGTHFNKDIEQNDEIVQRIFASLKQKFYEILSDNRLQLQQPIVDVLLQKIKSMQLQVGFSPRNVSNGFLNEYYERIELDASNFYVNQLSLLRLTVEKSHESLEPAVASNFLAIDNSTYLLAESITATSSPYYIKPRNLIIVPYGFMQMPVYHRNLNDIFKYSVLGFIIAHEVLHGFDSNGIDYDSVGNIMGPSEEIAANHRFMRGLRCMQNELATGSRSLNEKLADYEGFRLVYDTYFNGSLLHEQSVGHVKVLPQFTSKQLFFIHFAQFFCGKVHRSVKQSAFLEHALDELRVLQTLANFEEFSKEFGCDKRAKMQSKVRCKLW
ncbi:phosphate-regulating neutral endopeptidase PHEX [Teleopsis dalmanni]|uniref:phosphate-regulating neutral endopeptidase PHEX n=1 Tax=Teleopsis dalmanni TaxID=139649 RepID=UPI0018CCB28C|nr:phosphate-regulating neutral endopeptidase PHEX [Teleopsis dalmanni]